MGYKMKGSTLYGKKLPGLQCDGYENMKDGKSKSSPFQQKKDDQRGIEKSPLESYGKNKK